MSPVLSTPYVGQKISISLPCETVLATVERVISEDSLVVTLNCGLVMGKTHDHKQGDTIGAIRQTDSLGRASWWGVDAEALAKRTQKKAKRNGT